MTAPTSADGIAATFSEWQMVKTRKVLKLVFEVPLEKQAEVLAVLGVPMPDVETWVGIARLKQKPAGEQPKPQEKRTWDDYSRAERAGILCNDNGFIIWLSDIYMGDFPIIFDASGKVAESREEWSARVVRRLCSVNSRAELTTNPAAWDAIESEYRQATGRDTEERG